MGWTRAAEIAQIGSFALALFFGLLEFWPRVREWSMTNWKAKLFFCFLILGIVFSVVQFVSLRYFPSMGLVEQRPLEWGEMTKETVYNRTFRNERVPLDGYTYIGCTFENVVFVYKGEGPIRLVNNTIRGRIIISTANSQPLGALMSLLQHIGVLRAELEHLGADQAYPIK